MRRKMKRISALALAAVLACSVAVVSETYATGTGEDRTKVDFTKTCTLEFDCASQYEYDANNTPIELEESFTELVAEKVQVDLYQVATLERDMTYKAVEAFKSVEIFEDDKKETFESWLKTGSTDRDAGSLSETTTASEWADIATALKGSLTTSSTPVKSGKASEIFGNLGLGLYLIDVKQLITDEYRYEFSPYLIALPNNYYHDMVDSNTTTIPAKAYEWEYNLTRENGLAIGLKPQQFPRYGYLEINKVLENYNVTNPSAVFVFEIQTTKDDFSYNDVVVIDYTNPGESAVRVGPIEVGAVVNVTEVYTGAGYEVKDETTSTLTATIVANTQWDDCDTYGAAKAKGLPGTDDTTFVGVTFTNKHNDIPNGGTGVVNTYKLTEEGSGFKWNFEQEYQGQDAPTTSTTP